MLRALERFQLGAMAAFIWLILFAASPINGMPNGAPSQVCNNGLTPGHGSPDNGLSPYRVTSSSGSYKQGLPIVVRIESISGESFKGFVVQAQDRYGKPLRGRWSSDQGKPISKCPSIVTHTNPEEKEDVSLEWTPSEGKGRVTFVATIVKVKDIYYPNLKAEVVGGSGSESQSRPRPPTRPRPPPQSRPRPQSRPQPEHEEEEDEEEVDERQPHRFQSSPFEHQPDFPDSGIPSQHLRQTAAGNDFNNAGSWGKPPGSGAWGSSGKTSRKPSRQQAPARKPVRDEEERGDGHGDGGDHHFERSEPFKDEGRMVFPQQAPQQHSMFLPPSGFPFQQRQSRFQRHHVEPAEAPARVESGSAFPGQQQSFSQVSFHQGPFSWRHHAFHPQANQRNN